MDKSKNGSLAANQPQRKTLRQMHEEFLVPSAVRIMHWLVDAHREGWQAVATWEPAVDMNLAREDVELVIANAGMDIVLLKKGGRGGGLRRAVIINTDKCELYLRKLEAVQRKLGNTEEQMNAALKELEDAVSGEGQE